MEDERIDLIIEMLKEIHEFNKIQTTINKLVSQEITELRKRTHIKH